MNCYLVNYPFLLVSDFSHINFNDSLDNYDFIKVSFTSRPDTNPFFWMSTLSN